MNLISCNSCGVVFDKNKLYFPKRNDNGTINHDDQFVWDGNEYIAYVWCPVCNTSIREKE